MAITILQNIQDYLPAYNRMELLVESDNVGEPNFKYVFRLFVEGETFGGVGYKEYQVTPDAVLNYGVVDIHNLIQTFVEADLGQFNGTSAFSYAQNSIKKYNIEIYEMWDIAGVPTINTEQGESGDTGDLYCFEGSFNNSFWIDWDASDYFTNLTNGVNGRWLTDNLLNKVSINDLGWSYYLTDSPSDNNYIQVLTYDSADALISTFEINNTTSLSPTPARFEKVTTSPQALNNVGVGQFAVGTQPVITSSVARYTVQLFDNTAAPVSELINFEIKEPCRYTEYRFHFENKYGAFDSFTFHGRNQKKTDMQRTSYKTSAYPIVTGAIQRLHQEKSNVTNWTKRTEKISLISDYLTTEENTWLEQMLYSNEIYLEFVDGSGVRNFKSVHKVTGTSWVEKETIHDKLFRLEIEVELGQEAYSQRK